MHASSHIRLYSRPSQLPAELEHSWFQLESTGFVSRCVALLLAVPYSVRAQTRMRAGALCRVKGYDLQGPHNQSRCVNRGGPDRVE